MILMNMFLTNFIECNVSVNCIYIRGLKPGMWC